MSWWLERFALNLFVSPEPYDNNYNILIHSNLSSHHFVPKLHLRIKVLQVLC